MVLKTYGEVFEEMGHGQFLNGHPEEYAEKMRRSRASFLESGAGNALISVSPMNWRNLL